MDPDLLLAIALSESLMVHGGGGSESANPDNQDNDDTANNNNNNNNKDSEMDTSSESPKPTDKFKLYFVELTKSLKADVLIDHMPLFNLLRSHNLNMLSPTQIFYLSQVVEYMSFLIIDGKLKNVDRSIINEFCKCSLDFCLMTLERWCDSVEHNSAEKKMMGSTPTHLLEIIDMLCCIEFPPSDLNKLSFDQCPSFLDFEVDVDAFFSSGKSTAAATAAGSEPKSDQQEQTQQPNITTTTDTPSKPTSTNVYSQFLKVGMKEAPAPPAGAPAASTAKYKEVASTARNDADANEELVKINSHYFKSIKGPSRMIAICSSLLLPYSPDLEVSERFQEFKDREEYTGYFINNVHDILFTEGFETLDIASIPWTIDFISRLIGTLRSYQAYNIKHQIPILKSNLFTQQLFENLFQLLGNKLSCPDLKAKAEIFVSLCILTDIERMNIRIEDIISNDRLVQKEYLCWRPQLVIMAINLVFEHLENNSNLEEHLLKTLAVNPAAMAGGGAIARREPETKFINYATSSTSTISSPSSTTTTEKQSIWFDYFTPKQFTQQELCQTFATNALLDSIFTILYISCCRIKETSSLVSGNVHSSGAPASAGAKDTPTAKDANNTSSSGDEENMFGGLFHDDGASDSGSSSSSDTSLSSSSNILFKTPTKGDQSGATLIESIYSLSKDDGDSELSYIKFVNELFAKATASQSAPLLHLLKSSLSLVHLRVLAQLLYFQSPGVRIDGERVGPLIHAPALTSLLQTVCFNITRNDCVSDDLTHQLIRTILMNKDKDGAFAVPSVIPREQLTWLAWMFVKLQSTRGAQDNDETATFLWDEFTSRTMQCAKSDNANDNNELKEVYDIDYIIFLLFTFHSMDDQHRLDIIKRAHDIIQTVVSRNRDTQFVPKSLIFSRFLLVVQYVIFNFDTMSSKLSTLFYSSILTSNVKPSASTEINQSIINKSYQYMLNDAQQLKSLLYEFNLGDAKCGWVEPAASQLLSSVTQLFERCHVSYQEFHQLVQFGLCGLVQPSPTVEASLQPTQSVLFDYIVSTSCVLVYSLPLPPSFMQAIKDKSLFATSITNESIIYLTYLTNLLHCPTSQQQSELMLEIPWNCIAKNVIGNIGKVNQQGKALRSQSLVDASLSLLIAIFDKQEISSSNNSTSNNNNNNNKTDSEDMEGWSHGLFDSGDDSKPSSTTTTTEDTKMDTEPSIAAPPVSPNAITPKSLGEMLPAVYECLIGLFVHYKKVHKQALTNQLISTNVDHIELVKECFSFSNKSDVSSLMESLTFPKEDREVVDRWTKLIKTDVPQLSKTQEVTFDWMIHRFHSLTSPPASKIGKSPLQYLDIISSQHIFSLLVDLAFVIIGIEGTSDRIPSLKLELSYEHMSLNIDQMLSFSKESQYLELSTNQLTYLINLAKIHSFERIIKSLVLLTPTQRQCPALETIITTNLDNIMLVAKSYPSHLYCYYISPSVSSSPMGDKFDVKLHTGDIISLLWLAMNNQSFTINRKAISTLIQVMAIPMPVDFLTSLRSHAITALSGVAFNDLQAWFEQKLLGVITPYDDPMITDDNNNNASGSSSTSTTISTSPLKPTNTQTQELVIRLIGLLIGVKEFYNFTSVQPTVEDKESDEEDIDIKPKSKAAKKLFAPKKAASPTLAPASPLPIVDIDWDESVKDIAPLLFDLLLGCFNTAFNQWVDYPHLLKGYFSLLQIVALKQNQLLKLFDVISNFTSPIIAKPSQKHIDSLNLILQFVENLLEIIKLDQPQVHHARHAQSHAREQATAAAASAPVPMVTDDDNSLVDNDEEEEEDDLDEEREWKAPNNLNNVTSELSHGDNIYYIEPEETAEAKLASMLCTYTTTKDEYMDQHWYSCYTCNLKDSEGCCGVCVRVCHKGHNVSYSRYTRFFCDCGAGVCKTPCKSMKTRTYQPKKQQQNGNSGQSSSQASGSSNSSSSQQSEGNSLFASFVTQQDKDKLLATIRSSTGSDIVSKINDLYPQLIQMYMLVSKPHVDVQKAPKFNIFPAPSEAKAKEIVADSDLFALKKSAKYNTFDAKIKYEGTEGNQMKNLIASGHIQRRAITSNSKGIVALAEGETVSIINVSKLLDDDAAIDKSSFKVLSKSAVQFPIVSMSFNPANERYLAVAGYKDCKILTINHRDEIVDQLLVDLSLYALGENIYIIKVEWVVGSQVELAVVTNEFIKIYNLAQDNLSPIHFYTLVEDYIRDMTIVRRNNTNYIVALAESGMLYFQAIQESIDDESCIMIETIQVPTAKVSSGVSVFSAPDLEMLICTYTNGEVHALKLDENMSVAGTFTINDPNLKTSMPSMNFLQLTPNFSNIFTCLASRGGFLLTVRLQMSEIAIQAIKMTLKVEGMTWVNKSAPKLLVLLDDGSLSRYDYNIDSPLTVAPKDTKPKEKIDLGIDLLSTIRNKLPTVKQADADSAPATPAVKTVAKSDPVFPIDFFERVECITPSTKYGGDPLQAYSKEEIKRKLEAAGEYIAGQNLDSLNIVLLNEDPDIVICGVRVLVGEASTKHIPTSLKVHNRVISCTEGMKRWYDIPLTQAESLKSSKKLTLTATATFNMTNPPIIDSLEVYGVDKDLIGWNDSDDHKKDEAFETHNPTESALHYSVTLLKYFFSLANGNSTSTDSGNYIERMRQNALQYLPSILSDPQLAFLQTSVKSLLKILNPSHEAYLSLKHTTLLQSASDAITRILKSTAHGASPMLTSNNSNIALADGDVERLEHIIRVLKKISCSRPNNLTNNLFATRPTFLADLMAVYRAATNQSSPPAVINALANEQVVSNITHFLWNCMQTQAFPTSQIFDLFKSLLTHSSEAVKTRSATALCSLINKSGAANLSTGAASQTNASKKRSGQDDSNDMVIDEIVFSCDRCSTKPILNKRWHCEACEDFDLCDNCYQTIRQSNEHPSDHTFTEHILDEPMKIDSAEPSAPEQPNKPAPPTTEEDEDLQAAIAMSLDLPEASASTSEQPATAAQEGNKEDSTLLLFRFFLDETVSLYEKGVQTILPFAQVFHALFVQLSPKVLASEHVNRFVDVAIKQLTSHDATLEKHLSNKTNSLDGDIMIILLLSILLDTDEHKHLQQQQQQQSSKTSTLPMSPLLMSTSQGSSTPILSQQVIYAVSEMLVKKGFVGILKHWLTQLFVVVSNQMNYSGESASTSPFGALLVNSHQDDQSLPKNRYTPFFSKALPQSINNYHQIIAKGLFKIAITFFRCERRKKKLEPTSAGDIAAPLFNNVEWTPLVCGYIHSKKTAQYVKYPKKLLLLICTTKPAYYSVRDEYLLKKKYDKILALQKQSGGFSEDIHYDQLIKLINYLTSMVEVASNRPHSWQYFSSNNNDVLLRLFNNLLYLPEDSSSLILELLTYAFVNEETTGKEDEKSGEEASSSSKDVKDKDKDVEMTDTSIAAKNIPMFLQGNMLDTLVNTMLLEPNSSNLRTNTSNFLYYLWKSSNDEQKVFINRILWSKLDQVVSYGKNANEFMELLTYFINGVDPSTWKHQFNEFADIFLKSFREQNQVIYNHPNSQIYSSLGTILDLEGYYLESEPCLVCNNPEVQYQTYRLDTLKQEAKFTESAQLIKFNGAYNIQKLTINISDIKKARMIKTINLYYNNKIITDIGELKGKFQQWKKLKQVHFTANQNEKTVRFQIPITATNFMIEYFDFHDNLQALATEKLQCPRCSRTVTDKHGLCKTCHENALQCKQCRNINYDHLEAFLCNECGYCKHARFDYSFTCKPTVSIEKIENQEDYKRAFVNIEKESENAHKKYQRLISFKKIIANLITSFQTQEPWPKEEMYNAATGTTAATTAATTQAAGGAQPAAATAASASNVLQQLKINRKIGYLSRLYEKECKVIFEGLSKSVQILISTRMEIIKYMNTIAKKPKTREGTLRASNNCFGCSCSFAEQSLSFLNHLSRNANLTELRDLLINKGLTKELFRNNIHQGKSESRNHARLAISYLTKNNQEATTQLNQWIKTKIDYVMDNYTSLDLPTMITSEMMLTRDCCQLSDPYWQTRLKFVMEVFFRSIEIGSENPVISEYIILPCLKIVLAMCTPDRSDLNVGAKDHDSEDTQKNLQSKFERFKLRKSPLSSPVATTDAAASGAAATSASSSSSSSSASSSRAVSTSQDGSSMSYFEQAEPSVKYDEWLNSFTFDSWSQRYQSSILANGEESGGRTSFTDLPTDLSQVDKEQRRREIRARFLATKYAAKWKARISSRKASSAGPNPLDGMFQDVWVKKLLFNSTSSIRVETINLMNILSRSSPTRTLKFLDLFVKMIPNASKVGEYSAEFFALFNKLIQSNERKVYLTLHKFIPYLCDMIISEIDRINSMESSFNTDVSEGFVLKTLVSILSSFVEVPTIKLKMKRDNMLDKVLDAFLSLRGIIIQKNKLTEDSVKQLQDIMKSLNSETNEDNKKFIAANIKALNKHINNGRTPIFIFEQICNIVCPVKPEPVYNMILTKASTQEDYIRGSMNKNPYPSNVVGPLMRDVKNKICKTLDLGSFLEDDNGMELLVDNKIIKLDLPIRKVYEQVWKRSAQAQRVQDANIPMMVIYRLQGLDGEATEEIIENLNDTNNEERDPEEEFEITTIMSQCGGMEAMLSIIERINDFSVEKELAQLVIKLLSVCVRIKVNRQQLITQNGVSRLLEKLKQAFHQPELAESLLLITEEIVSEANRTYLSNSNSKIATLSHHKSSAEAQEQMAMFLDKLTSPLVKSNSKLIQAMTRVIPFLTYGYREVMQSLVDFFAPSLQFEELDAKQLPKDSPITTHMDYFTKIADSTRADENGYTLRTLILEHGITEKLFKYIDDHFPEGKDKASKEWTDSLELPALPYVLVLLKGLANGHEPTQRMAMDKGILKRIHMMEQITTGASLGTLAENLLESLKEGNSQVAQEINAIRVESRTEKMKQAEKHRMEVLKELGLSQQGKHITASFVPGSIEDLEDEEGFTCMVCREGYSFKPDECSWSVHLHQEGSLAYQ
ncbi:hypothetical protein SAMD00019534_111130 [Acytostelium subglobosum LB1]|uniref:hypothetical protein n=1 Tax=Acytostelium subglobosum LB1 TaxID=1410327 RepID=UPI0006448367|nr:hypothetical protein SAMD00019534_111130 [Acytostelium subglobosum LB1]GAM27937.1 hypothetical protein SAMD00019534_111130 [Acytostelium subglobosum LB1]|eukprot:XP_012749220.1 hypothetical protein SAMD00019534_111130 [Acytostelium subglobosum LB1]